MLLTIDRQTWYRGYDGAKLLTGTTGRRCCLGFLGQACGIPDQLMLDKAYPTHSECIGQFADSPAKFLVDGTTKLGAVPPQEMLRAGLYGYEPFTAINDDPELTDTDREAKLTELFAQHDIQVTFIN